MAKRQRHLAALPVQVDTEPADAVLLVCEVRIAGFFERFLATFVDDFINRCADEFFVRYEVGDFNETRIDAEGNGAVFTDVPIRGTAFDAGFEDSLEF